MVCVYLLPPSGCPPCTYASSRSSLARSPSLGSPPFSPAGRARGGPHPLRTYTRRPRRRPAWMPRGRSPAARAVTCAFLWKVPRRAAALWPPACPGVGGRRARPRAGAEAAGWGPLLHGGPRRARPGHRTSVHALRVARTLTVQNKSHPQQVAPSVHARCLPTLRPAAARPARLRAPARGITVPVPPRAWSGRPASARLQRPEFTSR